MAYGLTKTLIAPKFRIVAGIALAVLVFFCGIHWDMDPLGLLCVVILFLTIIPMITVRRCAACGRDSIPIGRGRNSCPKCKAPYTVPPVSIFSVHGRIRLAFELPFALELLFFSFRFISLPILLL